MARYLCGRNCYIEILNKPEITIWTNTSDKLTNKRKHECFLRQCRNCGYVYQPVTSDLRSILNEIYSSNCAQLSTPMGKGNWRLQRAKWKK